MRKSGFTLIELLIVVAIIGILAAIAVPNFLNAQIRAKIARSQADMRSTLTAVEQMRLERGMMLIDFWDDDTDWGKDRMANDFGGVGDVGEANRRQVHVLAPLTSPISYMSSVPQDPFAPNSLENASGGHSERFGIAGNDVYYYADFDMQDDRGGGGYGGTRYNPPFKKGDYILMAFGPASAEVYNSNGIRFGIPYDVSNGVHSIGDIMMKSGGGSVRSDGR